MKLIELLSALPESDVLIDKTISCLDVDLDSRNIVKGSVFIAVAGFESDGRHYMQAACEQGAVAIIYEVESLPDSAQEFMGSYKGDCIFVGVVGLKAYVADLGAHFFGHPSEELQVYGVTGTNGKTSCAYLLSQSFNQLGFKTAFMGTIGLGLPGALVESTHTTLDAISIQRQLAELLDNEFTHVCMEVSSHALDQGRVSSVQFYAVLFTNLSHDHLDYHKTIENYAQAKRKLFTDFQPTLAIINADDEFGAALIGQTNAEFIVTYGNSGDVKAEELKAEPAGLSFAVITESLDFDVSSPVIGELNLPNLLLVTATLLALGVESEQISDVIANAQSAPGRMELFESLAANETHASVIVDFAHTPDALARALQSARNHCEGKLWTVFGCGGDRDQSKRALMGEAAEKNADQIVVTSDNPRNESPLAIIDQIMDGIGDAKGGNVLVIEDRPTAVAYAINQANHNDLVLIAGKGHEDYQVLAGESIYYSDREWVQECLEAAA